MLAESSKGMEIKVTLFAVPRPAVMFIVTNPTGSVVAVVAEAEVDIATAKKEASASLTGSFIVVVIWGCCVSLEIGCGMSTEIAKKVPCRDGLDIRCGGDVHAL
jgi:hypothetical protein